MAEEGLDVIGSPCGEFTQKNRTVQSRAGLESYLPPGYPCRLGYPPRRSTGSPTLSFNLGKQNLFTKTKLFANFFSRFKVV